jgi:hypothetical protein
MHVSTRFLVAGVSFLFLIVPAWSQSPVPKAEYKRADSNFYLRRDVLRADPGAVVLPSSAFNHPEAWSAGGPDPWVGSFYFQPRKKAPTEVYVHGTEDWLEPITPPDMPLTPAELGITPDTMQIRAMQGDVQVALPTNPSSFAPATEGETIPDGTTVKTGANGTAAVLFGGINSARLAPNSEASVEQTVTPDLRSTRVDLKSGAVFSKVGLRPGEKQDYEVRTAWGTALAKGTDFLTVAATDHADVFVAQGTVEFNGPDGQHIAEAKSTGKGELQVIQSALAASVGQAPPPVVTDELTMALNFIQGVNLNVKGLHDRIAAGAKLAPQEKKYLSLIRQVPILAKLALVPPPPPPPVVAAPLSSVPLHAFVHFDGTVDFQGKTLLTPDQFKAQLDEMMKTAPHKILILHAGNDVPYANIKALIDLGRQAGLKKVTLRLTEPKKDSQVVVPPAMKVHASMAPRPEATGPVAATSDSSTVSPAADPISPTSTDSLPMTPLPDQSSTKSGSIP